MDKDTNPIDLLGGPSRVAQILGQAGVRVSLQRVGNWRRRGIPAKVLLENPRLVLAIKRARRRAHVRQSARGGRYA